MTLRCGEKLSELYNTLSARKTLNNLTADEYLVSVHNYSRILADYSENHADVDYLLFMSNHKKQEGSQILQWIARAYWDVRNLTHIWASSVFYIAAPPAFIFAAFVWFPL